MLNGLWLAFLGVLAVPNMIVAKKPNAKELIDKIAPYQGWIGAISALWGVWQAFRALIHIGVMAHAPIAWFTWAANAVLLICLGLLLGVGVIKTFVKQAEATKKIDDVIAKLAPYQGTLGLVAIGVGAWMVLSQLLMRLG